MKKEIKGKRYVQVPENANNSCEGCAAEITGPLCMELRSGTGCLDKIWEVDVETKTEAANVRLGTALELVEEINRGIYNDNRFIMEDVLEDLPGLLVEVKTAIEREQVQCQSIAYQQAKQITHQSNTIKHMNESLKSAIHMRPISELPDKVPDGCVCVQVSPEYISYATVGGVNTTKSGYATDFYILPLPVKEQKLHPCRRRTGQKSNESLKNKEARMNSENTALELADQMLDYWCPDRARERVWELKKVIELERTAYNNKISCLQDTIDTLTDELRIRADL